jgi:hypothetical protein
VRLGLGQPVHEDRAEELAHPVRVLEEAGLHLEPRVELLGLGPELGLADLHAVVHRVGPAPATDAEEARDDRLRLGDENVGDVEPEAPAPLVPAVGEAADAALDAAGQAPGVEGVEDAPLRQERRERLDARRRLGGEPVALAERSINALAARHRAHSRADERSMTTIPAARAVLTGLWIC